MTQPLRRMNDVPDDPPPAATTDPGILALLKQVASGLEKIEALEKRVKALEDQPRTIQNHVHVPKIEIPKSADVSVAAPIVNLPPMEVHLPAAEPRKPCEFVHEIKRNSQGRAERIVSKEVG